jgi:hypothetical protein
VVRRRDRIRAPLVGALAGVGALAVASCTQGEGFLHLGRGSVDAGLPPFIFIDGSARPAPGQDANLAPIAPHSVRSVDPAHGSFAGGQHAVIRGTGFASTVRVFFGDAEVAQSDVLPIDPGRLQVTVPPGKAGSVDVSTQNADDASTRSVLRGGFTYDPFYVDPGSGPVSGGTLVTIHGDGTSWDDSTEVLIDGEPCEVARVETDPDLPQVIECAIPTGSPGAKVVTIRTGEREDAVADAFTYGDSNDGFRGGLAGKPLNGSLRVIVLNSATGRAVPGATVILGSEATPDSTRKADDRGVVVLNDASLEGKVTVTIAAKCLQPATFVDVPVDTVTAYLDPILALKCADLSFGGIGGGGGTTRAPAGVEGELVWPGGIEFRRAPWDVPYPESVDASPDLQRVAYIFELSPDPTRDFRLPGSRGSVSPETGGRRGYAFESNAGIGNLTLYALAGVEDRSRSPSLFTAYKLGVLSGVATSSGQTTSDIYIPMDVPLDHAIQVSVDGPAPTSRGPDRVEVKLAVRLGTLGYVILPIGAQQTFLPATSPLGFVGVPPLVGGLAGAEYILTAEAHSGAGRGLPRSVIASRVTSTPAAPIGLGGFVNVPELTEPARNTAWNARDLEVNHAPGGKEADLTIVDIVNDGGLSTWMVVAPRGVTRVRLPDIGALGVAPGPVTLNVTRASLDSFVYGSLRYGQLGSGSFRAYALDAFQVHRE